MSSGSAHTPLVQLLPATTGKGLYTTLPAAIAMRYDGIGTSCGVDVSGQAKGRCGGGKDLVVDVHDLVAADDLTIVCRPVFRWRDTDGGHQSGQDGGDCCGVGLSQHRLGYHGQNEVEIYSRS